MYGIYLLGLTNGQIHVYLIALSVKINKPNIFQVLIQVNHTDFVLRLICMFFGYDLPIKGVLKWLSSTYDDRLVDHSYNLATNSHHKL